MPKSTKPARKAGAKVVLSSPKSGLHTHLLARQGKAGGFARQIKPVPLPGKSRGR